MVISRKVQQRFVLSLFFGIAVFFALVLFGNAHSISGILHGFEWKLLPVILALAFLNYFIRFLRWQYYLRRTDIQLPRYTSWLIFLSGLAMSITPGKLGEVLKSYYVRETAGIPLSRTIGVVFGERFTDLSAIILLAGIGALAFHSGVLIVCISLGLVGFVLLFILSRRLTNWLFSLLRKIRRLEKSVHHLENLYENAHAVLRPMPFFLGTGIGALAWFCECFGFFLVLRGLGQHQPIGVAVFIYAFATLVGAISFLPGGLGTTEGSIAGLLIARGVPRDVSSAATLLIRAATLWFAVFLGLAWFLPNQKRLSQSEPTLAPV